MNTIDPHAPVNTLAGAGFFCECGKQHSFNVEKIVIDNHSGVLAAASDFFLTHGFTRILVVADETTVSRLDISPLLELGSLSLLYHVFPAHPDLVPDEKALGALAMAIDKKTDCIAAVGSGTINDLSRFAASLCGLPYVIFPTAASMDGYTSSVSPLIQNNRKTTFSAITPGAVFVDLDTIAAAPVRMVRAGFGDVIGKFTALADWLLSSLVCDEYYCPQISLLMRTALERCVLLDLSPVPDAAAVMECLLLSGSAMAFAGNSRPASGAEHHIAHYWEMDALRNERGHALHGEMVGVACVAVARLYEMSQVLSKYPALQVPPCAQIRDILKRAGAFYSPQQIGIDRSLFIESIQNAMYVRDRYTILRYLQNEQKLNEYSHMLADELYR